MIEIELRPERMDTIELDTLIPGIDPIRIPLLVHGIEKLPIVPGVVLRNAAGKEIGSNRVSHLIGGTQRPPQQPRYTKEDEILRDTEGQIEDLWEIDDGDGEFLDVRGVLDATNAQTDAEDNDLIL